MVGMRGDGASQFKYPAGGFADRRECKLAALLFCCLQCFYQRGNTGAVNIANLRQVDDHVAGVFNTFQQGFSCSR